MDRSSSSSYSRGARRGRGSGGGGRGGSVGGSGRGGGGGRGRGPTQDNTNPPPVQPVPVEGGGASRVAGSTRPESSGPGGRRDWADIESSEQQLPSLSESSEKRRGGRPAVRSIQLQVNLFSVVYNPYKTIMDYDADVKPEETSPGSRLMRIFIPKFDKRLIFVFCCIFIFLFSTDSFND